MDIRDVVKKIVAIFPDIFTAKNMEVLTSPGFRELAQNAQLKKFFITPSTQLVPTNDNQCIIIGDDFAGFGELHLSADEIGEMGGQLIIHEDQASTVNLSDAGWMRVKNEDVKFIDESLNDFLYETFIHESGVVLQVEPNVEIKLWEIEA